MVRYEQIAAGSSWVGEYGSVAIPEEAAFLASISPYANIQRDVSYPQPLVWTTSKDDRGGRNTPASLRRGSANPRFLIITTKSSMAAEL